jgi:glutaredoxin-like protein NrdH
MANMVSLFHKHRPAPRAICPRRANLSPFAITIWSKPSCVQCTATKRALDKGGLVEGVDYEVKNLPDFPELVEAFKAEGLMQAPIVESAFVDTFSGYNVGLVKEIVAAAKAA